MDYKTYEVEAKVEESHWWFVGRRALFKTIIESINLGINANILDIGTSTGTNLRMLRDVGYTNVKGLDLNDEAISWCSNKGWGDVSKGDICNIPSDGNVYNLILATDIIEHVDDDLQALKEIYRVLCSGGYAIITVPAFQSLWGLQDDVSHHKRRYRKKELLHRLKDSGLEFVQCYYFNYILFIPILFARKLIQLFNVKLSSEN